MEEYYPENAPCVNYTFLVRMGDETTSPRPSTSVYRLFLRGGWTLKRSGSLPCPLYGPGSGFCLLKGATERIAPAGRLCGTFFVRTDQTMHLVAIESQRGNASGDPRPVSASLSGYDAPPNGKSKSRPYHSGPKLRVSAVIFLTSTRN